MPPYLRMFLVFWTLGLLAFAAEYLFPARVVSYRSVFLRDLVALGVYNLCFLLVVPLTERIPIPNYAPAGLLNCHWHTSCCCFISSKISAFTGSIA